jgi:hypothetical protein
MTDTLSQLIPKLQALLLGDTTTFSSATCTAAIRQALKELNLSVPRHAAETVEAVSGQYEYELSDSTALKIVDVLRQGTDAYADCSISLDFDAYFEDERPFFRLRTPEADGTTLIVRYACPHTIDGLDESTDSTLPPFHDVVLLDGAAWQACLVRAAGTIETINYNPEVSKNYAQLARFYETAFKTSLAALQHHCFPVSELDRRNWKDEWEGMW